MEKSKVKINGEFFERIPVGIDKNFQYYWLKDPHFYAMREERGVIIEWWHYSDDLPPSNRDVFISWPKNRTTTRIRQFSEEEFWRRMKLQAFQ